MGKFLSKHLGKLALMTAAALWASCSEAKEDKAEKPIAEKPQTSQTDDFKESLKNINKNANSKYVPSSKMDTASVVATLYGSINYGDPLYGVVTLYESFRANSTESATFNESDVVIADGSSLTAVEVYETTRKRIQGLLHYYRKYLKKKQDFEGTIVLMLKIEASGIVSNITIENSNTNYQEFDAEIAKMVNRWKFPISKTGGSVTIPFSFKKSN